MEKGVPIRSITRAIAALKAINRLGSLTMMEIAREVRVPYPTACRIVQTLLYEGLIEQEPARKRYRPTALVQSLSHGFQADDELVRVARPSIVALTEKVGWPISIAVRVGRNMMLRDTTHANTSLTFEHYYPGYTVPLLESASGKLALAFAEEEERQTILRWMYADQDQDAGAAGSEEPEIGFADIKAQGYAVQWRNNFNLTPGKTSSIAAPILRNGKFEAAMTMIFFASALKVNVAIEKYLGEMRATADAIGRNLEKVDVAVGA